MHCHSYFMTEHVLTNPKAVGGEKVQEPFRIRFASYSTTLFLCFNLLYYCSLQGPPQKNTTPPSGPPMTADAATPSPSSTTATAAGGGDLPECPGCKRRVRTEMYSEFQCGRHPLCENCRNLPECPAHIGSRRRFI